ncbi:ATP-dependent DNA ligase [Propionibacteriaceae bacterium Y1685]|uniref:ATP-dependent DNA ligase n=1 Tax=Microlunatus sp. Y1700 TaxID=3418487 RepID=UPI003B7866CD
MSIDVWGSEPIKPMLAKAVTDIPAGMAYEPKWDGFRCLVQRIDDKITLWSRGGKDLTVYFPELVAALLEATPARCLLDGEIVIITEDRLDFERLQERIHPAASRIAKLSVERPAQFIAFDLLALDDENLTTTPEADRRKALEAALDTDHDAVHLTAQTLDLDVAKDWFVRFEGAGLDGVIAKPLDGTYQPDKRTMFKIKHKRTADVVVLGFRLHKNSTEETPLLGSLQLGLFDETGTCQFIGVASSFPTAKRAELATLLLAQEVGPGDAGFDEHPWAEAATEMHDRRPGAISRWSGSQGRVEQEGHLIMPLLVVEISFDYFEGTRLRHNGQVVRWRTDREPESCTYEQIEVPTAVGISTVFDA